MSALAISASPLARCAGESRLGGARRPGSSSQLLKSIPALPLSQHSQASNRVGPVPVRGQRSSTRHAAPRSNDRHPRPRSPPAQRQHPGLGDSTPRSDSALLSSASPSPQETESPPSIPDAAPALAGAATTSSAALSAGEDAASFAAGQQTWGSWGAFFAVLGVVMGILYLVWISPDTGVGTAYADVFKGLSDNREVQMSLMLLVFAIVHSGGAALRPAAEEVIGPRAYRVLFAGLSLPLAVSAVVFFINHRYDGDVLWQLRGVTGMHSFVWATSLVSFFFLYPSTFNLLEVAAVDTPRLHLWGTGIARITRHPQMWGQLMWCLAHTLWIGSSFTLTTSLVLCLHHAFGVWHGEKRLAAKYRDKFEEVKEKTSIVPFAAILQGRQTLPPDYYKEFVRVPYLGVLAFAVGAYFVHPLMIRASFYLHW